MIHHKTLAEYRHPDCRVFLIQAEGSLCFSPDTPQTTAPGFNGGPIGGYDDDNPYFG